MSDLHVVNNRSVRPDRACNLVRVPPEVDQDAGASGELERGGRLLEFDRERDHVGRVRGDRGVEPVALLGDQGGGEVEEAKPELGACARQPRANLLGGYMRTIDFSREVAGGRRAADPRPTANLDYHERARARLRLGPAAWQPGTRLADTLNPNGDDAALFHATRAAALRVLHGANMAAEAARIGQSPEFLRNHLRSLLMPAMFG